MKYLIINTTDITQDMIDRAAQTNAFTLRENHDGSSVVLKFPDDALPLSLKELGYSPMTRKEAMAIVNGEGWDQPPVGLVAKVKRRFSKQKQLEA